MKDNQKRSQAAAAVKKGIVGACKAAHQQY